MLLIVVPFGNFREAERREAQRVAFIEHMKKHFDGQDIHVVISEQKKPVQFFNRGQVLNLGVDWAVKHIGVPDVIVFHDVDMLPNRKLMQQYYGPYEAKQLLPMSETQRKIYSFQVRIGGGISGFSYATFQKMNGYPNFFWGWGGEDDAVSQRLQRIGVRPIYNKYGDYKSTDEQRKDHASKMAYLKKNNLRNMLVWEMLKEDKARWRTDGYNALSTLHTREVSCETLFDRKNSKGQRLVITQVAFDLDETSMATAVAHDAY